MEPSDPAEPTFPCSPHARQVMVLQGGGALGSYQAGAFHALCEHGFKPHWIAGISIGAVNAAIMAGNPPERRHARLKEFWELASSPVPWQPPLLGDQPRSLFNEFSAAWIAAFGVPGFFTPRFPPAILWPAGTPQSVSVYDTAPLRETMRRLVDFDLINAKTVRLSVGAVNVRTGNFTYFDNAYQEIGPDHILASAALPPGFPPIEIDGEHYWDGGIVSNTPLDYVLDQEENLDLLIFQVDLFSARGPLPRSLLEALEREKDIRYSSRTRLNTDANKRLHNTRKAIRDLIRKLPDDLKADSLVATLNEAAKENAVSVVHLIYREKNYEANSKDYDFSRIGVLDHWTAGERDVRHALKNPKWMTQEPSDEAMVTYDLNQDQSQ